MNKFFEFVKRNWKLLAAALGTIIAGVLAAVAASNNQARSAAIDKAKADVAVSENNDKNRTSDVKASEDAKTETKKVVEDAKVVSDNSAKVIKDAEAKKDLNKPIEEKIEQVVSDNKETIASNKETISDARKEIEEMKREAGL